MAELVDDRYALKAGFKPRQGGMSVVQQAIDITCGDLVAIKFVQAPDDSITDKIFEREVSALRTVQHPNVVKLYGSGRDKAGRRYLALEWVDRSLDDAIADLGPFTWEDALDLFALPLARALASAHLKGVEHRDIKPGNVLLRANGDPVLADFGIGKLRGPEKSVMTVSNWRSGVFAPPEFEAEAPYVRDTYSMGVLLTQLLVEEELLDLRQVHEAIAQLALPIDARRFLEACTSADASERPGNGSVLLQDLQRLRGGPGGSKKPTVFLALTKRVRADLAAQGQPEDEVESTLLRDLTEGTHAEFAFDHERGVRDESKVVLIGDQYRYIGVPQDESGELLLIGARFLGEDFYALEAARRRSAPVGAWLAWSVSRPARPASGQESLTALSQALIDFYDSKNLDVNAERAVDADVEGLFDGWLRVLQAREEVERGDRVPLDYSSRDVKNRSVKFTLREMPDAELIGTEWELRSGSRVLNSAEVVRQDADTLTLEIRGKARAIAPTGTLYPRLGPARVALQRQNDAIQAVRSGTSANPALAQLLARPSSAQAPAELELDFSLGEKLDDDKRAAVLAGLGTHDLMVVKGPPGTGKTTFIVELVRSLIALNPEARVLIVSQTHVAVDNALGRLDTAGIPGLVRLGSESDPRVAQAVHHLTLDRQMARWAGQVASEAQAHMRQLCTDQGLSERHLLAAAALQGFIGLAREQALVEAALVREGEPAQAIATDLGLVDDAASLQLRLDALSERQLELVAEARRHVSSDLTLRDELSVSEAEHAIELLLADSPDSNRLLDILRLQTEWLQRIQSDEHLGAFFLAQCRVIAGTCLGFLRYAVKDLEFDFCILDEASKATATEALVPLARSKRAVLVGDDHQLPPQDEELLRRSDIMSENELSPSLVKETLFERLSQLLPPENQRTLTSQYRMVRPIGDLISNCFYEGTLRSPRADRWVGLNHLGSAVLWLDTSKGGDKRREARGGTSYVNRYEAELVMDRLAVIDKAIASGFIKVPSASSPASVLLVTPYQQQVAELRRRLAKQGAGNLQVSVESVDAVQGREADITIFSVVRSNPRAEPGFLGRDYWRRVNVALSRARESLVIIGDAEFCELSAGALGDVIVYMKEHPEDCEVRDASDAR